LPYRVDEEKAKHAEFAKSALDQVEMKRIKDGFGKV